jgi:hypothetical protein
MSAKIAMNRDCQQDEFMRPNGPAKTQLKKLDRDAFCWQEVRL